MLKRNRLTAGYFPKGTRHYLCVVILLISLVGIDSVAAMPDRPPASILSPVLTTVTSATASWPPLPHKGLNYLFYALAVKDDGLNIAGDFTQVGDGSLTNLGGIVRDNTTTRTWHALANQGLTLTMVTVSAVLYFRKPLNVIETYFCGNWQR